MRGERRARGKVMEFGTVSQAGDRHHIDAQQSGARAQVGGEGDQGSLHPLQLCPVHQPFRSRMNGASLDLHGYVEAPAAQEQVDLPVDRAQVARHHGKTTRGEETGGGILAEPPQVGSPRPRVSPPCHR